MIEDHFDNLTNYMGGLHPELAPWFDLLLGLAEKGLLDYKILYEMEMENGSVHPAVREWLEDNLETLRSNSQTEWTSAEDETLHELHDVFNKAFFKGALSQERSTLRFIRKKIQMAPQPRTGRPAMPGRRKGMDQLQAVAEV